MNTNVFRLLLLGSLFSLSACVQQSEVRQMKHSVSTLNQEMTQLIDILHALKDVDSLLRSGCRLNHFGGFLLQRAA